MGISGNLKTMALAELLQWLSMGQKTGTLKFESKKVVKKIFFEKGVIISSASTDPNEYLGRFLVNHGYLPDERVTEAIQRQREEKKLLGTILVEMGDITSDDLDQMLRLKAEESIYDVFTWDEAAFEFFDNELPAENFIRMELDVQWIVLEGSRRTDEWYRIKERVPSEHCVPVIVVDLAQAEIEEVDRRILEWIDDDRTVEEISQGAQVALFQVSGLIAQAAADGWVKIVKPRIIEVEIRVPAGEKAGETALTTGAPATGAPATGAPAKVEATNESGVFYLPMMPGQPPVPLQMQQLQQLYAMQGMMQGMSNAGYPMMPGMMPGQMPMQGQGQNQGQGQMNQGQMNQGQMNQGQSNQGQMQGPPSPPVDLGTGRTLHFAGNREQASGAVAAMPGSEAERMIHEAESALSREDLVHALDSFRKAKSAAGTNGQIESRAKSGEERIDQALERLGLMMTVKPKLTCDMNELTKLDISPQEGYMLTRADGTYDIKSILKIVPLGKLDAKMLFWKLRKSGHISF